jgi:hypothetical protein
LPSSPPRVTRPTVEITRRYEHTDADDLAESMNLQVLPADLDLADVARQMPGTTVSAFVRATEPA